MGWSTGWLWLAVVASGLYHGLNPAMGWPLAVSAGLIEGKPRALFLALWPLSVGHFVAMLLVLLPIAILFAVAKWQREMQAVAALLIIGFGVFRLIRPRHPKLLVRIPPRKLGLWSFAIAIAHGAGLMLVPIYLGLCGASFGQEAWGPFVRANLATAVVAAVVHVTAMIIAGGCLAWLVYRYLGLKFLSRSWFNLDASWAISLVLVGAIALAIDH